MNDNDRLFGLLKQACFVLRWKHGRLAELTDKDARIIADALIAVGWRYEPKTEAETKP